MSSMAKPRTLARMSVTPAPLDFTQAPQAVSQLPAKVDLNFYQGDDVTFDVAVTQSDGTPYDVSTADPQAQIRTTAPDPEVLAEFTIAVDGTTAGLLHLYLTHTDTAPLPQSGVWDLQLTTPLEGGVDNILTIAAGKVTVAREVTR